MVNSGVSDRDAAQGVVTSGVGRGWRYGASWFIWPLILVACIAITAYGFSFGQQLLFFNVAYVFLFISLFFLERIMPHETVWLNADGQIGPDLLHTLSSKGTVQGLLLFGGVIGLTDALMQPIAVDVGGIWPRDWPIIAQVLLGMVTAEFGLYWAHRLGHVWMPLWNFHAIHHSVERLWIVNTGRFHFVDSLVSIVVSMVILVAMDAPAEVIQWVSAVTAFIGMLTHCNIEMRFGPLSWVFNTPELHRWHHSKDLREGDKNFGENLVLWDFVFFSYFNERRRPPVNIGLKSGWMPPKFLHQLAYPFRKGHYRQIGIELGKIDPDVDER